MILTNEHQKILENALKEYRQRNGKVYIGFPIGYVGANPFVYSLVQAGYLKELYEPAVWDGTWGENLIVITDKGLEALEELRQRQHEIDKAMHGGTIP